MTEEGKEIINAMQEMMLDLKKELKEEISSVKEELSGRLDNVEGQVSSVKMILENEIRPNIQLLVEGHKQNAEKLDKLEPIAEDVEYIKLKTDVIEAVTKVQAYDISHLKRIK